MIHDANVRLYDARTRTLDTQENARGKLSQYPELINQQDLGTDILTWLACVCIFTLVWILEYVKRSTSYLTSLLVQSQNSLNSVLRSNPKVRIQNEKGRNRNDDVTEVPQ